MKAHYNVNGKDRKALVTAIGEITGEKPKYLGMPTASYQVGVYTVDKDGAVSCESDDLMRSLVRLLTEQGYEPESTEDDAPAENDGDEAAVNGESTGLTVSLPASKASVGNLTNLLEAKGSLIKKALGIDDIGIRVEGDTISFPWFETLPDADEVKAYTHFIAALGKMSRDLKRISATEKEVDNEKYAFRCFLLRLGFIGNEYKAERTILLKNLSGNSSWKNGAPEKEVAACE